jgi:hypothetical protein
MVVLVENSIHYYYYNPLVLSLSSSYHYYLTIVVDAVVVLYQTFVDVHQLLVVVVDIDDEIHYVSQLHDPVNK